MSTKGSLSTKYPGTIVRRALMVEGAVTFGAGFLLMSYPTTLLQKIISSPDSITPLAESVTQWTGALTLGLGLGCTLAARNTKTAVEGRPLLYWTLGGAEVILGSVMFWQMVQGEQTGLSVDGLKFVLSQVAPALVWRVITLAFKPHWFGTWVGGSKTE